MNIMTRSESPETNKYRLITRRIDQAKIRHKSRRELRVNTTIVKNLKMVPEGNIRSGAIIYTHYRGKTYFCLGIDSIYGDLTDFSGGVKKEESIVEGGLRELYEESQGIFGILSWDDIKESLCFHTPNMLTMFIRLEVEMDDCIQDFYQNLNHKLQQNLDVEVSGIKWLETQEFLESVNGRGSMLYTRVRKMLSKVTEIIRAL